MAATKTVSASLPMDIANMLNMIASEKKWKIGEVVKEAIEMYIAEWSDYNIAIKRLNDPTDKILGEDEFLAEMKEECGWEL